MPSSTSRSERQIVDDILREIRYAGWWAEKVHGGGFQRRGLPDILAVVQGRALAIEVKRPGKKTTPIQQHVLDEIIESRGYAAVVSDPAVVRRAMENWPYVCRRCLRHNQWENMICHDCFSTTDQAETDNRSASNGADDG